jgi:hypothetical protein
VEIQVGVEADRLPGVISERANRPGRALDRLGESLARIHAAHSVTGDFKLGEEIPKHERPEAGFSFYGGDFEWFKAVIRAIAPDIKPEQISYAARNGRARLHNPTGK